MESRTRHKIMSMVEFATPFRQHLSGDRITFPRFCGGVRATFFRGCCVILAHQEANSLVFGFNAKDVCLQGFTETNGAVETALLIKKCSTAKQTTLRACATPFRRLCVGCGPQERSAPGTRLGRGAGDTSGPRSAVGKWVRRATTKWPPSDRRAIAPSGDRNRTAGDRRSTDNSA